MTRRRVRVDLAAACGSLAVVAVLLWYFHDRFWWPVDDGVYAYVAQRLLAGDRLHLDLIDLHAGFGNLANAFAFAAFGEDLRSLRLPLAMLTLLQSGLVFWLLRERGPLIAATGALAAGTLSFIQFLNPSANWYALFVCILTIAVAARIDVSDRGGLVLLGFLLGLCFFTRQLSGVILTIGTLTWLMLRLAATDGQKAFAGRVFGAFLAAGLGAYLLSKASATALLLVGIWPLWLGGLAILRVDIRAAALARMLGWLLAGAIVAALPLVVLHVANGAFLAWLYDIFVVALLIHGQDFVAQEDYSYLFVSALATLAAPPSAAAALSSLGWIAVLLTFPLAGYACVRHARDADHAAEIHPLAVIAPFWAVVAVHYQIPIYLFFALPVVLPALLLLAPRRPVTVAILLLCVWGTWFQAAQPLSRGYLGAIEGRRVELGPPAKLPRVSLRIEPRDEEIFQAVIDYIEVEARPGEPLMTLPMEPELNFMTGRKSPVRYYGTPLGLTDAADVDATIERLAASAPLFVVHRREDKYLTPLSARLLERVRASSPAPVAIGPFDLYRLPAPGAERPTPDRE